MEIPKQNQTDQFTYLKAELESLKQELREGYAFGKLNNEQDSIDFDCIFLGVNPSFEKLTGLPKEDIIGHSLKELFPAASEHWGNTIAEITSKGGSMQVDNFSFDSEKSFTAQIYSSEKNYFSILLSENEKLSKEKQVSPSVSFFYDVAETMKEGVWVADENDIIRYANDSLCEIVGTQKATFIDKSVTKDFPTERIREFLSFFQKAKKTLKPVKYETQILSKTKRTIYQSGWLLPIHNHGKYEGMVCTIYDLAEHEEYRELIKKREELLQNIIEHSTNAFYSHTTDHVLTFFSPQIEKIIGYKPQEVLVKWTTLVSDNPINERGWVQTNKALQTGEVQEPYELELIHKNGSKIRVEVREAPVVKEGKTIAIVGSLTDITERTRIADELRVSQEGLRNLIDNSPVAIAINDRHGNITYLNKEFVRVFGYTQDEIKHVDEWFPLAYPDPGYRKEVIKHWKETVKAGISGSGFVQKPFEATITCKNNQRKFVQIKWTHIGTDLLLIFNNMTEQKTLQNQLVESNLELKATLSKLRNLNSELNLAKQQAEESDHLKSAFLANMSHEIRTPMNSIIGFSSLLTDDDLEEEKKNKFSDLIQTAGQHLLRIIDDIIDISKIESNQLKIENVKFNVHDLLEEIYNYHNQSNLRKKKPELEFQLSPHNYPNRIHLNTDQIRLKQLFDNLITNALKNTPEGKVEFGIYEVDETANRITFWVKDTGVGIPDKFKELIFNRFLQVDNRLPKNGTGLGLSITKGIIDLLGGRIWFETQENAGTTFYFELPFDPSLDIIPRQEPTPKKKAGKRLDNRLIFIAEDDYHSFLYLKEVIRPTGAQIQHFTNGQSLVNKVETAHPDLIFVDINMPIMDGIEAVEKIRKTGFTGPVIAQTAYAMLEEKEKCLAAGCNDYIPKPVDIKSLLNLLYKYLGG